MWQGRRAKGASATYAAERGAAGGGARIAAAVVGLSAVFGAQCAPAAETVKSGNPAAVAQSVPPSSATTIVEKRRARSDAPKPEKSGGVSATHAELTGSEAATTFLLDFSSGVQAEVFTLADPYRVVIDLPDVVFRLPKGAGQDGKGLVSAFRYGLLAEGKARIVMDTRQAGADRQGRHDPRARTGRSGFRSSSRRRRLRRSAAAPVGSARRRRRR